jgi:hypothetical protein
MRYKRLMPVKMRRQYQKIEFNLEPHRIIPIYFQLSIISYQKSYPGFNFK